MFSHLLESWASVYANHAALRTGVEFLHLGGLVAGGGCAITADLATIVAARDASATRTTQLHLLNRTHHIVVLGLVALTFSGLLLFTADVETFWYSRIFWIKMCLMALLVVNGALLSTRRAPADTWRRPSVGAIASDRRGQPRLVVLDDAGRCRTSEYRIASHEDEPRDQTSVRMRRRAWRPGVMPTDGRFSSRPAVSAPLVALFGVTSPEAWPLPLSVIAGEQNGDERGIRFPPRTATISTTPHN